MTIRNLSRRLERLEAQRGADPGMGERVLSEESRALLRDVIVSIAGPERVGPERAAAIDAELARLRPGPRLGPTAGAAAREVLDNVIASLERAVEAHPEWRGRRRA